MAPAPDICLKDGTTLINTSSPQVTAGRSKFWRALHDTERLALHATIYNWSARQIQPGWVLDLGCEYGIGSLLITEANPKLSVLGIDLDFPALCYSQGIPYKETIPWVNASGYKLPIASESLTGICLINLLHRVKNTDAVLSEAWRVLRSGGAAVLSLPPNDYLEKGQCRSFLIKQLGSEMEDLFSEVIYPNEIFGQFPSFPPQSFVLDKQASPWIAFCRKN
jgi:SAM-dependent methyltransferase